MAHRRAPKDAGKKCFGIDLIQDKGLTETFVEKLSFSTNVQRVNHCITTSHVVVSVVINVVVKLAAGRAAAPAPRP